MVTHGESTSLTSEWKTSPSCSLEWMKVKESPVSDAFHRIKWSTVAVGDVPAYTEADLNHLRFPVHHLDQHVSC